MKIPRIVVAGTTSGIGKTTITCAIIHGIKKSGYTVQPFKVGPDYIDPSYLSEISGKEATNLDAWLMGKHELLKSFVHNSQADISIIEGVMGYYDGFSGKSNFSSTHHVATILDAPVVLVLDASKTARSIAAMALGFTKFHKNSHIVGFILNKIGSKRHENLCRQALQPLRIPILGVIPKDSSQFMDSRHMGLIPIAEQKSLKQKIKKIASKFSNYLEIDKIIDVSMKSPQLQKIPKQTTKKTKTTIAIALDGSFNFYYKDNLNALQREGAKIKFFSPVQDSRVPTCDGLYIGGGFPEVLGHCLEKNQKMKKNIKDLAQQNLPIYAECGGLMYLTNSILYKDNKKKFQMVGLFDADTTMTKKLKLFYTKATVLSECLISAPKASMKGHEFHFSEINSLARDSKFAYKLSIGEGIRNHKDGLMVYNTLASYCHLYFDSSSYASRFVSNCVKFSRK